MDTGPAITGANTGYAINYNDSGASNDSLRTVIHNGGSPLVAVAEANNGFASNQWGLAMSRYQNGATGNDLTLRIDSNPAASGETNNTHDPGNSTGVLGLGIGRPANGTGAFGLFGAISEILIYDRALNDNEIKLVNTALNDKYNLNLSDVFLPEPTAATFIVVGAIGLTRRQKRSCCAY